ncbi:sensor histidine kinase [Paenilisteria rocourtiae]|uniref:histidine kinase n=1 Tax=Listeria rocourtiae TaxID=647910 RepID=A0A4R6ZM11_9LIST|nr:HAMP domain-containing sensor histidine kinase [Listeria rocourtiae]EUJ45009.1 putative sensor histidine kinase SrrB [Listeria rocourtiae FSL F6-920]MBC1434322.1 HAMP domain-containing histidine kinase [Listeria rocourtiae]MBC1604016.1 HAMP domain-containing histidine kinase [Listeria rocourtiae]TDR53470.1 signal transduction histidine kinase [Listeria rocourtiae]
MSKLGRKLTWRISAVVIGVFALSMLVNQFFLPKYYHYEMKQKVTQAMKEVDRWDKLQIESDLGILEAKYDVTIVSERMSNNVDDLNEMLRLDLAQKRIALNRFWITGETLEELKKGAIITKLYDQGKQKSSFLVSMNEKDGLLIMAGVSIAYYDETAKVINEFNLMLMLFGSILVVALTGFLSRKITKPLEELKIVANQISKLEFEKVTVETKDELEDLATSINVMSDDLKKAHHALLRRNKDLKYFMADLTHELKTPLALIKAYSMGIQDGLDDGTYMATIVKQTNHISAIIEELLRFSKMEVDPLRLEKIQVRKLFDELLTNYQETTGMDIRIKSEISPEVSILADKAKLEMVFNNLITNAVKYATTKQIKIEWAERDNKVYFAIKNETTIVSQETLGHIWKPFYVREASRNKNYSGTGLGLAIVQTVMEQHEFKYGAMIDEGWITFYLIFDRLE